MNTKNLKLTSTVNMNREQWLEFRQPRNHIRNFVTDSLGKLPHEWTYDELVNLFQSDQWKEFEFPTIGGSEISTIMGLNPYQSSVELYFEKVGAKPVFDIDNSAMFWGRELEEQIAEKWQYWKENSETMIQNFNNGTIQRKCRRLNAYVQNKSFPWIFVSLDRVINKQVKVGLEEKIEITEGVLECKTIVGFVANMWETGIPVMYVAQLQTQLMVLELDFGEMAILKDGRYLEVYPFDKSEAIHDRLIKESNLFFRLVKRGASEFLLYQYCQDEDQKQSHYSVMENMAPEPDGSEAYKNYLSERYQQGQNTGVIGGVVELELARSYKFYAGKKEAFETLQMECSNKLKGFMKECERIDLGLDGSVTWKNNVKGSRVFRVTVKDEPGFLPDAFKPQEALLVEAEQILAPVEDKPTLGPGEGQQVNSGQLAQVDLSGNPVNGPQNDFKPQEAPESSTKLSQAGGPVKPRTVKKQGKPGQYDQFTIEEDKSQQDEIIDEDNIHLGEVVPGNPREKDRKPRKKNPGSK